MNRATWAGMFAGAGLVLVSACGGDRRSDAAPCVVGTTLPCECSPGVPGANVCQPGGAGYSICQCGGGAAGVGAGMGGAGGQSGTGEAGMGGTGGASGAAGSGGTGGTAGSGGTGGTGGETAGAGGAGGATGGDEVPASSHCAEVANWDPAWTAWEDEVLRLTNEARAVGHNCDSEGNFGPTTPLTTNPALRCAARLHSRDMIQNGYFAHDSQDGRDPFDRMMQAGYSGGTMGENIASGQTSPAAVVQGWLDSDGHCSNIMSPAFDELGVGYYYAPGSNPWVSSHMWTQNFGGAGWGGF